MAFGGTADRVGRSFAVTAACWFARAKVTVGECGTCFDARRIKNAEPADGVQRSTMAELTSWTQWAVEVPVF